MISITLAIVIITSIVSITAFSNQKVISDLIFNPPAIKNRNQWYRFFSCALIHGDLLHLIFNMFTFYSLGSMVEQYFSVLFGRMGGPLYVILYVVSQFLCLIPTYIKHQDDYSYMSLGASGAVSAVVFAAILLSPTTKLVVFVFPMPAFVFGAIFLAGSFYLDRKGPSGNNMPAYNSRRQSSSINHSAHLWGALAGIILFLIFSYSFAHFDAIGNFVYQVRSYVGF
jgi:membrane associated rhomboid family serine protease